MHIGVTFFCLALSLLTLSAGATQGESLSGYSLQQFGDFERNWHLVTVRYRKDTGEMRFTYANPIAWEVMRENKIEYPDGAVFAKVAVMTQQDLSFPSSLVPSGVRRIQFMVRDAAKHSVSDGWGYELFDSAGKIFPGDAKTQVIACTACHRIVKDRGEIFSQPMSLLHPAAGDWTSRLHFEDTPFSALPKRARELLPNKTKLVRTLAGDLRKDLFFGTLDEIQPLLAQEVSRSHHAAGVISIDEKQFSVVYPGNQSDCAAQSKSIALVAAHTLPSETTKLYVTKFCQSSAP